MQGFGRVGLGDVDAWLYVFRFNVLGRSGVGRVLCFGIWVSRNSSGLTASGDLTDVSSCSPLLQAETLSPLNPNL